MKLLLASSEAHPYSKTGGLADMVGALAKTLARAGHQVGLVTPLYAGIRERFPDIKHLDYRLDLPLRDKSVRGEVWTLEPVPGLTIYFIAQPGYYERSGLYQEENEGRDYPDNAARFIFFSKTVAHLAQYLPWHPELVHAHDWQTGLAVLFIDHLKKRAGWQDG